MTRFAYRTIRALALIFLAGATTNFIPGSTSSISGIVTDAEGAVISKALIVVHWDPSGSQVGLSDNIGIKRDLSATTGSDGTFSFDVPAGFYDVFVSAMAFSPSFRKIRVKSNKTECLEVPLAVDPLVSRELAH